MNTVTSLLFNGLEKRLGCLSYLPPYSLQPWVQCLWYVPQRKEYSLASANQYPTGGSSLIFSFSEQEHVSIALDTQQKHRRVVLADSQERIGVRFHPGGLGQMFHLPMQDFIHRIFDQHETLEALPSAQGLLTRLSTTPKREERIESIWYWLSEVALCQAKTNAVQDYLATLNHEVKRQPMLISQRQLERLFKKEVGITPSKLKRFYRVQSARLQITVNPWKALTDIALDNGFYDQSHFIRQFQAITNHTPSAYRKRKQQESIRAQTSNV